MILDDIFRFRGEVTQGANPHRFVELAGGREVAMMFHEPDPNTFRDKYYYNSRINSLFLLVETFKPPVGSGLPKPSYATIYKYWKKVNEY